MKYLKYFKTSNEHSTYKNSSDFITPNVSYVEENEGVSYNPLVLITCKVGNNQYQAREGMTWRQWVDSEYNVDNFEIRFGNKLCPYSAGLPEYFYGRNFDSKVPAVNPNIIVMDNASNFLKIKVSVNIQSDVGPQVEMNTFIEVPWEQIVNDKICPLG